MNETKQPAQNLEGDITRTAFWGTIALAVTSLLTCTYFFSVLFQQTRTPVMYAAMAVFLLAIVVALTGIVLTISRRQELGVKLLFYTSYVIGFSAVTLFQGRALSTSLSILLIAAMVIRWLFPSHASRRPYLVFSIAAFLLMWVIEWINPSWRIQLEVVELGPAAVIGFVDILVVIAVFQTWRSLSLRWKMGGIVAVLFLGTVGVAISGYYGLQSLRYQISNIYDFMLVPIVAINDADTALADTQLKLGNLDELGEAEAAQTVADIEANNKVTSDVIQKYDTEWVTTVSPEFTRALREAGKLDWQQQELESLAKFHTSFDSYRATSEQYIQSIQAGQPDKDLAARAGASLQASREALRALIAINNQYADFSNLEAQASHRNALISGSLALGIGLVIGLLISFLIVASITGRLHELAQFAATVQEGKLDRRLVTVWNDEISLLGTAFNEMTANLQGSFATLEQRVADRTRNLELAAEVGRAVSQVRALDVMLKDAAELIRSQFDLYYVQVYLSDPSQTNLLLLSGTGRVGEQLVGRSHRLPLNTGSINGRAAMEKKAVVIADTTASATFRPNPLLPDTRSEMAVPLIVGDKVVGVLDLQSEKANALSQELLPAFEALAGQVAIAIQNANLLAEAEEARVEVEKQARRLVRANWADYMDAIHKPEETGFVFEQNKVMPLAPTEEAQSAERGNSLAAPIEVTGEAVGNLVVEMEGESSIARSDELVDTIARQVAQHIEGLRLLESAERYRFEAEEASRRLSRDGWKTFVENTEESLGYFYDLKEVRPHAGNGYAESAVALPLKVRDEVMGKLAIQGLDANDSQSLELAHAVAERLSAHVESLRQFEETKRGQVELDRRAQQLAAVAEISTVSSKELNIQKMLESVVHLTQRKFSLYHAHIFTFDEMTAELQIAACGWNEGNEHEGTHETISIPLDKEQSLVARAARTRQAVIVNDVQSENGWLANPLLPDTASEMAVPLVIGDQVLGVLDVQSDRINAFTEEDANIHTTLAAQIATALQNARSFEQAQRQAEQESMLNTIGQKIQSATSVEAVLQIAARELGRALGAPLTVAQLGVSTKAGGSNGNGN
ncbi:MAG TPA: GAF domain-containing protein [Anaerolineales bacterium]|nr:GAF domain-containing protein [Anaerolineales bacterium]